MAAIDLTTIESLKLFLQISNANDDSVLAPLITSASQFFLDRTGRGPNLLATDYTERRDGNDSDVMYAKHWPINSVAGVTVSGVAIAASPDGIKSGYVFDDKRIILIGYSYSGIAYFLGLSGYNRGRLNVTLQYNAGYSGIAALPDVEYAVQKLIANRYKGRKHIGQTAQTIDGMTTAFTKNDVTPDVAAIIENYRNRMFIA